MPSKRSFLSHTHRAFTLVELMIVIAIIGILAAALFPSMSNYIARANNRALIEEMRKIGMAANMDFNDFGNYAPDVYPSGCRYTLPAYGNAWTSQNNPRFVTNGLISSTKYNSVAQKVNPDYCIDWNNLDYLYPGWASINIISVTPTEGLVTIKQYCLYQGKFDANATQCQNIGIDP